MRSSSEGARSRRQAPVGRAGRGPRRAEAPAGAGAAAPALPPAGPPVDPEALAALEPAEHPEVDRLAAAVSSAAATVTAPVTQLADAAMCARRYQLLHELRLEERPDREHPLPDPLGDEPGSPATALGTLAHRLLELIPLELDAAQRRAELERLLALEGEDPAAHGEVLDA